MKITRLKDRTILESEPNEVFLDMLKNQANNPFSITNLKSDIQIGMEFEFYIPLDKKTSNERLDDLDDKATHLINNLSFFNKKIIALDAGSELEKDLTAAYLEKDDTLNNSCGEGFEFVSPMMNLEDVPFYMKTASEAISDIGYSASDCGLHFHISSKKLQDTDMAKLMTFLHAENGLFDGYVDRNSYVKSLERAFLNTNIDEFNERVKDQTKQWDIVFLENNHIELRVFGGEDVYENADKVLQRLNTFLDIYRIASTPDLEKDLYQSLIKENLECGHHKLEPISLEILLELAEEIKKEKNSSFGKAFEEAFIQAEYEQIVPQKFIEDFNKKYELEKIPTI